VWALERGTQLETRPRYTPTTCFETFPLPSRDEEARRRIGEAADGLDRLRANWLNPPEWVIEDLIEFPASLTGPWAQQVNAPDARGIGTATYRWMLPKDDDTDKELNKRTLTNLYNEGPQWLLDAHRALDEAVFAAYGWSPSLSDAELLAQLLDLNLARVAAEGAADDRPLLSADEA